MKRRPAIINYRTLLAESEKREKTLTAEILKRDDTILRLTKQLDAERGLVAALEKMSYRPNQLACYLEKLDTARRIHRAVGEWAGKKPLKKRTLNLKIPL